MKNLSVFSKYTLSNREMKELKGGITWNMAHCITGAWGCGNPFSFCTKFCSSNYCCNECEIC